MRLALVTLALLSVAGCDIGADPPDPEPIEPDPVGATVLYSVTLPDSTASAVVTYTDAEGDPRSVSPDLSRSTLFEQSVDLPAGTTGTFALSATALLDPGAQIEIAIRVIETDDPVRRVTEAAATATATASNTEPTASAEVEVPLVYPEIVN